MKKKLVLLCLYCVFFNCIFPVLLHAQTAKINPFVLRINKLINQKLKENALTKDIRNKLFFNSDGKNIPEDSNPEFVINPCEQTISINNGQTIAGSLASTDCQIADGSYIDFYSFSALAGDRVTISMNSSLFDTFLYLQNQ